MSESKTKRPTFTYRAGVVSICAVIAMAMWIHFHEVVVGFGIVAENSPPAAAVGIFIGVIMIAGLISRLRGRLQLSPPELVVIYTVLVVAAPLMSQGMWHRFLGLIVAIPHNEHLDTLVDSYSDKLWPHGDYLVRNRRFEQGLTEDAQAAPPSRVRVIRVEETPVGPTGAAELTNPADEGEAGELPETELRLRIDRWSDGRERLVPGERYYFAALFRLDGLSSRSSVEVELVSDGGETVPVEVLRRNTETNFSARGAFLRKTEPYVSIPRDLDERAELVFTLRGQGRAAITDVVFFSNEALARLHKGTTEIRASDLAKVPPSSRDALLVRPDNLLSFTGIWYVLKGYVPYGQWIGPLLYWVAICLAVFFCLLGISVIFRKQWAENERFTFPMVVVPRLLIEQKDTDGRIIRPLFRKRTFWAGAILAMVYCLLQGLAHYVPGMPDPTVNVDLTEYFASPAVKAMVRGFYNSNFHIILLMVSIAFFVDLEMLASILLFYWLFKIPFYFGEVFGWKNLKGPVDNFPFHQEQHIGSFLAFALIVLWVARRHLRGVWLRILRRPGGIDDSEEAFGYRTAVAMILLSFLVFAVWGTMTGLGAGSSLIFFSFIVVCGFAAARIRTEMGAPWTYFTPYFPYLIFFLLGGLPVFGMETMVLAYCVGGFMAVAQFLMFAPSQVEMMYLGGQFEARQKGVSWALIVGMLAGVLLGGYVMLVWAYGVGGENIPYMSNWAIRQHWYLNSLSWAVNEANASAAAAAQGQEAAVSYPVAPLTAAGFGALFTVLLTVLRARFVGFWLHPIGYVLANTYFAYMTWGSLLVAWIVKLISLKVGGPRLIREHMTPLFAGVFCGSIAGIVFWNVVAGIALSQGVRDVFSCFP